MLALSVGRLEQGQASKAPAAPVVPALPQNPGSPTGGAQKIVIRDGQPVVPGGSGQSGTPTPTSTGQPDFPDPDAIARAVQETVIPIMGIALAMLAVIFIGWPLARAWARRMDRHTDKALVPAADVVPHIRQLQESVDAMAVELERIGEAQRFQARLMSEKVPVIPVREGPRS